MPSISSSCVITEIFFEFVNRDIFLFSRFCTYAFSNTANAEVRIDPFTVATMLFVLQANLLQHGVSCLKCTANLNAI